MKISLTCFKTRFFKFGTFLFFLLSGITLLINKFLKFKLFLKKFIKKPEKTLKKLWITPVYVKSISLKSKGSRMGKGKGKKILRLLKLKPMTSFVEVQNIKLSQLIFFLKYLKLWLNVNALIYSNSLEFNINKYSNKNLTIKNYFLK